MIKKRYNKILLSSLTILMLVLQTCSFGTTNVLNTFKVEKSLANDMCSVDVDTVLIIDRSGSMADGETQSSCSWKQYEWVGSTKKCVSYNQAGLTEAECLAKPDWPQCDSPIFTAAKPSKLTNAKNAADTFLNNFKSNDQSALVSYATTATLDKTLSNNHASTLTAVNALVADGATNIGDAIALGIQELSSTRANPQASKSMVLLTDGLANMPSGVDPVAYAESQATIAAGLGYKIFTVGLGDDGQIDQVMLQNIADITGANYHHVPNGSDLSPIYEDIAYEVCQYGSISGCLNEDKNNNSTLDTGEEGLSGWEMVLSTGTSTTLYQDTDQDGCFQFAGLTDGTYSVFEGPNADKGDFVITSPQSQIYADVIIADHADITDTNFLNYLSSCGNNITDSSEQCDDGNLTDGDGCSATCTTEQIDCVSSELSRICTANGIANVTYYWNNSQCGQNYTQDEADSLCACQASDTGVEGECVADGQRQHYFTYNFDYCGQDYEESQTDATCDCVASESARECVGDNSAEVTYSYNYGFCGSDYTETKEDLACGSEYQCSEWQDEECVDNALRQQTRTCEDQYGTSYPDSRSVSDDTCSCQSSETNRTCAGDGFADVNYSYNFGYCGDDYQNQETDSSCGCQTSDTGQVGECVGDSLRQHYFTYNYGYCGADFENPQSDATCACVASELLRECKNSSEADVTYSYNFGYCGANYNQTEEDLSCDSDYECSAWENGDCSGDGLRDQSRTCTDQYGSSYPDSRSTEDASCGCVETEVSGSCTDTTHREFTFTYNFSYCTQKPAEQRTDSSCDTGGGETCEYSTWENGECYADGMRQQTRTQTNTLDGCTDLTQNISDDSCGCVETEVQGSCTDTTHREFTFTYNFSYCTQRPAEQRVDSSCGGGGGGGDSLGSISGCKFLDANYNFNISDDTVTLSGWDISLSGSASTTTATDVNGCYIFRDLSAGTYQVKEGVNSGKVPFIQTYPTTTPTYNITLEQSEDKLNVNFGNYLPVCGNGILDTKYNEKCDDGNLADGDGCSATCQVTYQCSDGVDNDGNSKIDYPEDSGCSSSNDDTEKTESSGGGGGGGSVILPPVAELNIFNEGESVGGDIAHFTWETNLNSNSTIIYSAEDEGHVLNKNTPALYGYAHSYKNPSDDLGVVLHSVDIPWLRACMVYYYRAVSEAGSVGTAFGNERSFKTFCPATIVEPIPSGVGGPTGELSEVKVVVPVVEQTEEEVIEPIHSTSSGQATPEEIVQLNGGFLASLASLLRGFGGTCFNGFPWWLILIFALYPAFKIYEAYSHRNKRHSLFSWVALFIVHIALALAFYFASVLIVFIWVFLAIGFANFFTNYFVSPRREEDKNKFLVELLTVLLLEILLLILHCYYLWLVLFILLICLAITLSFKEKVINNQQ